MIQFTEDYRAITDPYCVILQKRRYIKNKDTAAIKETWKNISYHATYEQALEALTDTRIKACRSTNELVEEIKNIKIMIKDLKLPNR